MGSCSSLSEPPRENNYRPEERNDRTRSLSEELFRGNVSVECPSTTKIVRIFTSSTFTDTHHERNALMERVYPALKEVCQQQGYEFQVVDMRWGVRDEATDDHMGTELCLREVDSCKKLSTGPYFVTFLSHKYGYRNFPNRIDAEEFEDLCEIIEENAKALLQTWFKKDDNAVPPTCVLQPISSILPEFLSADKDERLFAKTTWQTQMATMQDALVSAATEKLDPDRAHRYRMSVTEAEISRGLLESGSAHECLWFQRIIEDIDEQEPNRLLSRYKDCIGSESRVTESRNLLMELRDKLPALLGPENRKTYNIKWSETGVDPVMNSQHQTYINQLCRDFLDKVSQMISSSIEAKRKADVASNLLGEIVEHTVFCQAKCKAFYGRQDTMDSILKYLGDRTRLPLVVHGTSGSGKTSIVAMTAKAVGESNRNAAVVLRFIGTTADSSTIIALLVSLTSQIWRIYQQEDCPKLPTNLKELTDVFHQSVTMARRDQPLVLLLDSLDQLQSSDGARQLAWLPAVLPENVKMVVSTLPEPQYECFPRLKEMFTSKEHFLSIPKLTHGDVDGIIRKWLAGAHRTLTELQRDLVFTAFQECPLPLFLKLSFDEASRWSSFSPESQTMLQSSVKGCIDALFARVEGIHGRMFVSRTLGYLTLSRTGLTESELEDILSCDDDVLTDVYMYWTPPVRRLPPLLLVRLRAELRQYLVDRGVDGVSVFFWYHRQFIDVATERYCADPAENRRMHTTLGDFFAGTWAHEASKPYVDKNGVASTADRKVAPQPLTLHDGFNVRKLNNLPYHRTKATQLDLIKGECLLNVAFLSAKLRSTGLRFILDDFLQAIAAYPDDEQLKTVLQCLQLSQNALLYYPGQLASQIVGRIRNAGFLKEFLESCRNSPEYSLLPNKRVLTAPGGQLIHCIAGHQQIITGIDMAEDSSFIVTCSRDNSVLLWETERGKIARSVENVGEKPTSVRLCCRDTIILVHPENSLLAIMVSTGAILYSIQLKVERSPFCVGGEKKDVIGVFCDRSVRLYAAEMGAFIQEVTCNLLSNSDTLSKQACHGSRYYMATTDAENSNVIVLDLHTRTFVHKTEIFGDGKTVDCFIFGNEGRDLYAFNSDTRVLHIYDTSTMQLKNQYTGLKNDQANEMKLTQDGTTLYFHNLFDVIAWNFKTDKRSVILNQTIRISDVVLKTKSRAVTISTDKVIRIWDLTREADGHGGEGEGEDLVLDTPTLDDGHTTSGHGQTDKETSDQKETVAIKLFITLPNPRYVFLRIERAEDTFLQIYDLSLDKVTRHLQVDRASAYIRPLKDSKRFLVLVEKKMKILDMFSGSVACTFSGNFWERYPSQTVAFVSGETEVAWPSKSRKYIKFHHMETGEVLARTRSNNGSCFIDLRSSQKGGVLTASSTVGECYVIDVTSHSCLYTVSAEDLGISHQIDFNLAYITNDDTYFVIRVRKIPSQAASESKYEFLLSCWDLEKRCVHRELVDMEYYLTYAREKTFKNSDVNIVKHLSNNSVVCRHSDGFIRVFDISSGEVIQRLPGYRYSVLEALSPGPHYMSQSLLNEDKVFKVIAKATGEVLATFSPDVEVFTLRLTSDGHHVVGFRKSSRQPVLWTLVGGNKESSAKSYKPLSSFPNIYGDEVVRAKVTLNLGDDDEDSDDPSDSDSRSQKKMAE